MSASANPGKLRALLKKLGNPYAFDVYEAELRREAEADHALVLVLDQSTVAQLSQADDGLRITENPYATTYFRPPADLLSPDAQLPASASATGDASPSDTGGISKDAFVKRCRAIFARYVPSVAGGKLSLHQRAFIARNEGRSPRSRKMLVAALERYDLASMPGLTPQFNRERGGFSEAKLNAIEAEVLKICGE